MRKIYFWGLISLFTFLISCEDDSSTGPATIDLDLSSEIAYNYFPLSEGNYWVYEVTYHNADGTPYDGFYKDQFSNSTDSMYIKRALVFDGKDAFEVHMQNDAGSSPPAYYTIDGDMVYTYAEVNDEQKAAVKAQGGFYVAPEGWIPFFSSTPDASEVIYYEEYEHNQSGMTMSGVYDYRFETADGGTRDILGDQVNTLDVTYAYMFEVEYSMPNIPTEFPTFTTETQFAGLFAENVGMVYMEQDLNGFNPSSAIMGDNPSLPEGFEMPVLPIRKMQLVRYSIN